MRHKFSFFSFICCLLIIGFGLYFALRVFNVFPALEIDIKNTGAVSQNADEENRIKSVFTGRNMLSVSKRSVMEVLENKEIVEDIKITRTLYGKVSIEIIYGDYKMKAFSEHDGLKTYYLVSDTELTIINEDNWEALDLLNTVELNYEYAKMISKWGFDEGFVQMMVLVSHLTQDTPISKIKYENDVYSFGYIDVTMASLNAKLCVREPVTCELLDISLEKIENDEVSSENETLYDLYSVALIKRS